MTNRTAGDTAATAFFGCARPVWIQGLEGEMNCHLGFRQVIEAKPRETTECALRITACSFHKAFVNGRFLAHGPAQGSEGRFRVDHLPIEPSMLKRGRNVVAIEVNAYNVNSFCALDHPGFLRAEVALGFPIRFHPRHE
jgi:alpha-L-rhamnosidase